MAAPALGDILRRRHRSLEARIAAVEFDARSRPARVTLLAEELVAHATIEQLVLYPYAEQLLGVPELSMEIERCLDALVGVVGAMDDDVMFAGAMARLSASFERHVDGDEACLFPMIEVLGDPVLLERMGCAVVDLERALAASRTEGPGFWPETAGDVVARGGGRN
jgi:hypothetical protein